jgi:5-methylcytosine-specific restriction endonuclease McrA
MIANADVELVERDGRLAAAAATVSRGRMSDRRYSTARWQRLRKAVLVHYGHVCQVQGPRCTGYATTVHHLVPSSQAPQLFWEPSNLVAACRRCNYGDGARVAAENTRQTIERLQQIIEEQQAQIDRLLEKLAAYEAAKPVKRAAPAIR